MSQDKDQARRRVAAYVLDIASRRITFDDAVNGLLNIVSDAYLAGEASVLAPDQEGSVPRRLRAFTITMQREAQALAATAKRINEELDLLEQRRNTLLADRSED